MRQKSLCIYKLKIITKLFKTSLFISVSDCAFFCGALRIFLCKFANMVVGSIDFIILRFCYLFNNTNIMNEIIPIVRARSMRKLRMMLNFFNLVLPSVGNLLPGCTRIKIRDVSIEKIIMVLCYLFILLLYCAGDLRLVI